MHISIALLAFSLALTPGSSAQQFLTTSKDGFVVLTDVSAGGLLLNNLIDVVGTATPPPHLALMDATVVDDEIWVSTFPRIYRYDLATLAFIGNIPIPSGPRGITVIGTSAWVAAGSQLLELTFDGLLVARYPMNDVTDVIELNGNLLVSDRATDTLDLLDMSGNFLGVFYGPQGGFDPKQLARSASGSILVAGILGVHEIDLGGTLRAVYPGGVYEVGVQETATGDLFISGAQPAFYIRKPQVTISLWDLRVNGYLSPFSIGSSRYSRVCSTTPNSVGPGALVSAMGSPSRSNSLTLLTADAVPGQFSFWIFGTQAGLSPLGDGTLCIDPAGAVQRLAASDVGPSGVAMQIVHLDQPPFTGFPVGTGLVFQMVYRDPGGSTGFNASDAVRVTLLP